MGRFSFQKNERLLNRSEFDRVLTHGRKRKVDRICTIYTLPNGLDRQRLGIIASRKIGGAVQRNRAKRKIREVFRHLKCRIDPAVDIVVISGRELPSLPYSDLEKKISQALLSPR
ncbi:MAG: ribonuclease P protein component [Nitrospinaceae bacterium]|nr:ribonuclease P protein component [Nitrospinaceae bacterium]NIR55566.1 ribonuclease P protein component [Nitrospinaceae bacterium]NIS86000.1 ribonuclease P protein component [Nitrospinaceae bacterium]NIT82846.1 ribonuclease P protein component [Nitrospinaceae bacterium]NIU45048.1 ribonuclease P protein component [Nitrospinaceae bacterium]